MPPATRALILVNVAVYLLQRFAGPSSSAVRALAARQRAFQPWQLLTYSFLHDPTSVAHIFFNMFALFMFGRALERTGARGASSSSTWCACWPRRSRSSPWNTPPARPSRCVGASGGVFGVLLAFAWYFPRERLFIIPDPDTPAGVAVRDAVRRVELFLGVTGRQAGRGALRPPRRHARRRALHPLLAAPVTASVERSPARRSGPRWVPQASHSRRLPKRPRPKVRPSGSVTQLPPPCTCASRRRTCSAQPGLAQNGAPRSSFAGDPSTSPPRPPGAPAAAGKALTACVRPLAAACGHSVTALA